MRDLLTDLIEDDQKDAGIFQPASKEEQDQREGERVALKRKEWLEEFIQRPDVRKNADGTYDVGESVDLAYGDLDELPVQFGLVAGSFYCGANRLKNLKGAPHEVYGSFDCGDNWLVSLEGAPKRVGRTFSCPGNELRDLRGAPVRVDRHFDCSSNPLESLEGAPEEVGKDFDVRGSRTKFTEEDVRAVCEVGGEVIV